MALNAKTAASGGTPIENLEIGSYPTRLVQVIDLGTQPQRAWEGKEKPDIEMIALTWEFVDEFLPDEDGNDDEEKPRWITEMMGFYNLEADKAKSTKRYNALDPDQKEDGDWSKLIGTPATVSIVHNAGKGKNKGRTYMNINEVSAMRAKDAKKCPALVNEPRVFNLDEPDIEVFNALPKFIKKKITENLNFEGSDLQTLIAEQPEKPEDKPDTKAAKDDDENPY
jgi:hypothetical protein